MKATLELDLQPTESLRILLEALANSLPPRVVAPEPGEAVQTAAQVAPGPLKIGQHSDSMGGIYAGITRGDDGQPDTHLFLLSDLPADKLKWSAAVDWAAGLGGGASLPTRAESALLYANLKTEIDSTEWHWTGTQYSDRNAWLQLFGNGNQDNGLKSYEGRCRAVRRLVL
jgi:hypothetical protein